MLSLCLVLCLISTSQNDSLAYIPEDGISFSVPFFHSHAEDMQDGYGVIPFFRLGGKINIDHSKSVVVSLSYAYNKGVFTDYYYIWWDGYSQRPIDVETTLKVFCVEAGGEFKTKVVNRRRVSAGGGIILAWATESLKDYNSGFSEGAFIFFQYEFFVKRTISVGFESRLQALAVRLTRKSPPDYWEYEYNYYIDLTGISLAPCISFYW